MKNTPEPKTVPSSAMGMLRLGLMVSSPSVAAPSKPAKLKMQKTMP